MSPNETIQAMLKLPKASQIGVVVEDVKKTAEYYSSFFGISPFKIYDFKPDKQWYMEKPTELVLRQGKTMWGDVELELMQPLGGNSLFHDHLKQYGEGFNHLGFNVKNYDKCMQKMKNANFAPLARVESYVSAYDGHVKACLFDTRQVGGLCFEIIWKSWLPECL